MKVDVCGIEYEVKEIESNSRTDTYMGRSDSKMNLITINKDMPEQQKAQTLVHEWLHCVLDNYCMDETNNEILVQTLASELYRTGYRIKVYK